MSKRKCGVLKAMGLCSIMPATQIPFYLFQCLNINVEFYSIQPLPLDSEYIKYITSAPTAILLLQYSH